MTTWITPKTWSTGEALTASDMNTHIRDNLDALKTPPTDEYTCDEASDYTTTSTTFVDIDATNLNLSITTTGGDVIVAFDGYFVPSAGVVFLDVLIDGVTALAGDDGIARNASGVNAHLSFVRLVTGLSAGVHTFKLQWKTDTGTVTFRAGAGATSSDLHPQFWVREV